MQAATNGIRFALEPEFAYQAKEAGLDMVYLQFDGTTNEANSHRHISNLFDVRQIAIDNLAAAGVRITPVVTVVNGVNNHMVGPDLRLLHEEPHQDGRPRLPARLLHGARRGGDGRGAPAPALHDLAPRPRPRHATTTARIDPLRDWYPLGSATAFAALADHMKGPEAEFGQLSCGCHPNCGAATMLVAQHPHRAVWAPITSFFDLDRFFRDLDVVVDSARGRAFSLTQLGLSFLRNFDAKKAPAGLTPGALADLFNSKMGGSVARRHGAEADGEWRTTSILSMWFQDLWNYDFRRTEMCVIPYGTQEGEISFCAYNTGVGWRNIIEQMRMVATTKDWYAQRGRHQIYAGDRPVALPGALKRHLPVVTEPSGEAEAKGCGTGCGCS